MSGILINNQLVMRDLQTRTLWSQFSSTAVEGPLAGTELDFVASQTISWAAWKKLHPDTLVFGIVPASK